MSGGTGSVTEVKVYSNAPEVELFLNGRSLGKRRSDDRIFRWPGVTLSPGENRVRAEAGHGGTPLTDACGWTLTAP